MASASDQTPQLAVSAPSCPDQIPTPTASLLDPTPPPSSAARKLPIKRRSPPQPSSPSSSGPTSSGDPLKQQGQAPFKFQRIWSESDELRFLQGLLGCGAQGLVFPRDLNIFYDRFSESMPQPYTRSQLSEKLRRLKKKYRNVSTRVTRGLDPARLAPHDRDVLHLCSRLWDPANAATSPFTANTGSSGNKRRRANARGVGALELPAASGDSNSHDYNGISSTTPTAFPDGNGDDVMYLEKESEHIYDDGGANLVAYRNLDGIAMEQSETVAAFPNVQNFAMEQAETVAVLPNIGNNGVANENENIKVMQPCSHELRMARAVLNVFEECLREAKVASEIISGGNLDGNAEESEHAKRWRSQRINELDVLNRRLRLFVEDAAAAGH